MTRRFKISIAALTLGLASAPNLHAAGTAEPISTESGKVSGQISDGILSYKGIPFAAPPVGPLRWQPPQPASRWKGVLSATAYGPDCMQKPFPSDAAPLGTKPAESCLFLNIWRPADAAKKLPVIVWIYGGGFVNGGASPPTYSGAALADKGVMVVSFNYRVGRFGTFAHPALAQDSQSINYGYMDQFAALHWVQRNIAAFGGDPKNVTVVGESAGGMSVHMLLTSPLNKGLFAKAVIQSGGPGGIPSDTIPQAQAIALRYAASQGIAENDPQALEKLRQLPPEAIVDGLNMAALFAPPVTPRTFNTPVEDGKISVEPVAAYKSGAFQHVPVMVGATSNDIGGPDGYMVRGAGLAAQVLAQQGVPVWYYRFSYVADSMMASSPRGASHATDIPFFFNTVAIKYGDKTTIRDRKAGELASSYLVNFAKNGNPNGDALPTWPAYDNTGAMMNLSASGTADLQTPPNPAH